MSIDTSTIIQIVTTGVILPFLWRVASSHTSMRDDVLIIKEQLKGGAQTHHRLETDIVAVRAKLAELELEIVRIKASSNR